MTGAWDEARGTEGAYTAFLAFEDGAAASLTYNGYGHFDTDELAGWIGEMGWPRDPSVYGAARAKLRGVSREAEAALKNERAYGTTLDAGEARASRTPPAYNHFGAVLVSCEHGVLRPMPDGVVVYGDAARRVEALPAPAVARAEVIDELVGAVREGRVPLHSGEWGLATLEVCLAMLESAREGREVFV